MTKEDNRRSDYMVWVVLAILMLGILVYSINYSLDMREENKALKQALIEQEGVRVLMVDGANKLYRSLRECREEVKE